MTPTSLGAIGTMDSITNKAEQLRNEISETEKKLDDLRKQLSELESTAPNTEFCAETVPDWKWPLKEEEYCRYGRQLILPTVAIKGQLKLKSTAVLIVGAGGLGCPAAAYLAGAGVGALGVVDGDVVEVSNLHRQIAHSTSRVGMSKVDSLIQYCRDLNPEVAYIPYREHLTPLNAESIVSKYDLVLDCTDHPTSRYLISDVCVLLQKTLVSASALRTDGQMMVLNNPPAPQGSVSGGPCYRCVFPKPPPADSVVSCGEGGILGPVVGVMGVLQALEAIKLITIRAGGEGISAQDEAIVPSLLLFSATSTTPFRSVKMRGRRPDCHACSSRSKMTVGELVTGSLDYVQFCGVALPVDVLKPKERISATKYHDILTKSGEPHLLLDVREKEHFDIASIPGAINVPFSTLQSRRKSSGHDEGSRPEYIPKSLPADAPIYVVCRVGNDSQLVTQTLKGMGLDEDGERFIGDIEGGMLAWKHEVDRTMPFT
ncbi:adenylyltransferase [Jackrogersella minutella]|nr:adenylyltransferase [Jackrogersella minutella]